MYEPTAAPPSRGIRRLLWITRMTTMFFFDQLVDAVGGYMRIVRREFELFAGALLTLLGLLNFESSKYCDGSAADYLSCTRPATYYYFDTLDVTFIILGVFFILVWMMKRNIPR